MQTKFSLVRSEGWQNNMEIRVFWIRSEGESGHGGLCPCQKIAVQWCANSLFASEVRESTTGPTRSFVFQTHAHCEFPEVFGDRELVFGSDCIYNERKNVRKVLYKHGA